MLLVISIVLFVVGLILLRCLDNDCWVIGVTLTVPSSVIILMMIIVMAVNYADADMSVIRYREKYKKITYKIEYGDYQKNEILFREIIDEIEEWNNDINMLKGRQNNFWYGILIPNIYDEFETIEYDSLSK